MIATATEADWLAVDRQGRSLEGGLGTVYDRIQPHHRDFFAMHLRHAFQGEEVECIVRGAGRMWERMQFWTMRPVTDCGEVAYVELTCSRLRPGDQRDNPWWSSLTPPEPKERL